MHVEEDQRTVWGQKGRTFRIWLAYLAYQKALLGLRGIDERLKLLLRLSRSTKGFEEFLGRRWLRSLTLTSMGK